MTPLAARYFRNSGNDVRAYLMECQFFECSALLPLASEMLTADVEAGCDIYSEFAQLPAPRTVIEFMWGERRAMAICEMDQGSLRYMFFGREGAEASFIYESGFKPGTPENLQSEWNLESRLQLATPSGMDTGTFRTEQARATNGCIEKMLCILNQPGLVSKEMQRADSRVRREATKLNRNVDLHWHKCVIRPGVHGHAGGDAEESAARQLHYVRKHFKPSLARWIEGYWRGNADLGIYLKHYTIQSPRKAA